MRGFLLFVLLACAAPAMAEGPWVYEFEFGYQIPSSSNRLFHPSCDKVVPVQFAEWYVADPRRGWQISCGNNQPIYNHFLGRRCAKPLPNLVFECGWRHLSSPNDGNELEYDAIAVRGRFSWGRG